MKILITGASGLIGNFIFCFLKSKGHELIGIDNFSNSTKKLGILEGDVGDLGLMNKLCKDVDVVFHCACLPYEGLSNFCPVAICKSVFDSSVTVATACVNNDVKRIINFSSMARYGKRPPHVYKPFSEENTLNPCDPYGVAKVSAENLLNTMSDLYGFDLIHLVPHNCFGLNLNWGDMRRGVINIFIRQALENKPITVHNQGRQIRSFCFVEDVFSFVDQLLECHIKNKEVFNVGPSEEESVMDVISLANFIISKTGSSSEIRFIEKYNDVPYATCTAEKIKKKFNWKSKLCLEDGIKNMIDYAKKLKKIEKTKPLPIEIEKMCPESWKIG